MDLSIDKFGQGEASIIARNGPTKSLGILRTLSTLHFEEFFQTHRAMKFQDKVFVCISF